MKRILCCLLFLVLTVMSGCGTPASPAGTNGASTETSVAKDGTGDPSATEQRAVKKYYIPEMEATISVPEEYSVFGKDIDYTDEMCYEAGVEPSGMAQYLSLSFDQAHIIPRGDSFTAPSIEICVKVKDNKYKGVDFGKMSEREYKEYADALIKEFSTDYATLEKNGMRFMVFDWNSPTGMSYRYATIINGDIIYIYAKVSGEGITNDQRELLESIATSIEQK